MPGVADQWPQHYRARFRSDAKLAYCAAVILLYLAWTRSAFRIAGVFVIIAMAISMGLLIATGSGFAEGWQIYAALPLIFVGGGVIVAIFVNPLTRQLYKPGSYSRVFVEQSKLTLDLNGNIFQSSLSEIVRVRHFGQLAAIEYTNRRFTILPTRMLPHYTHIPRSEESSE